MLRTSLPSVKTSIPGPKSEVLMKRRIDSVPSGASYGIPVFIEKGEGAMVQDVDGNVFLDFVGGIGVMNIGHSNEEVLKVLKDQLDKYTHMMVNVLQYEPYVELAEKLNEITPGDFEKKTLFLNSGAEANENAVKIARKYTKRTEIVVFTGAFHGRTNLTMGMTGKVKPYKHGFGPFTPGIHRAEFPYIYRRPFGVSEEDAMEYYIEKIDFFFKEYVSPDEVAAIIIEPLQGEGGFIPAPVEYIKALRKVCDENGILLVADEIQTGFCRTGRMFASEYWLDEGIEFDMILCAKSIAAGIPLSAVVGRAEVMDSSQFGGIGGTYGGNPVAIAAALKVIEIMVRDNYAEKSKIIGEKVIARLKEMDEKYPIIGDIRGMGSMIGLELVDDKATKKPSSILNDIIKDCNNKGLVIMSSGNRGTVLRFLMPLCITDEQLEAGMNILEEAIKNNISKIK